MWKVRDDEPSYAVLPEKRSDAVNIYEAPIDLIARSGGQAPSNRQMFINDEPDVGSHVNRNQQHAFHFTADNCIGCHACEAACSEKNDLPAHISFRSVGYVEGGTYPDFKRMNISMACNHCDDPVCLKGCPTGAYSKHAEYGAVLQDPETCFGCGYCTWVCPYNAPQLDPIAGQVSKCNMCVDRLEVGLKPACVSACLGNALNFGVVEDIPDNRVQAKTQLPGFPSPDITHPNIRFQQTKTMPDEVTRTDGMPVKYRKREGGSYQAVVDHKQGQTHHWSFIRLSSRENPLVIFTLTVQAAIGAFFGVFAGALAGVGSLNQLSESVVYIPLLMTLLMTAGLGLFMSTVHLGKPLRFYRGFNNLRYSPVCREGLGVCVFIACVALHMLCLLPSNVLFQSLLFKAFGITPLPAITWLENTAVVFGSLALFAGVMGLYYMVRCYLIPARPFWNHSHTAFSFVGNSMILGGVLIALISVPALWILTGGAQDLLTVTAVMIAGGMALEAIGLIKHRHDMKAGNHEGAASYYIQCTAFGKTYITRNAMLLINLLAATILVTSDVNNIPGAIAWTILAFSVIAVALVGRALFYVLVVPTTMPGAFFWKNKDFEQHARDIGLAKLPQVGVVADMH